MQMAHLNLKDPKVAGILFSCCSQLAPTLLVQERIAFDLKWDVPLAEPSNPPGAPGFNASVQGYQSSFRGQGGSVSSEGKLHILPSPYSAPA